MVEENRGPSCQYNSSQMMVAMLISPVARISSDFWIRNSSGSSGRIPELRRKSEMLADACMTLPPG
jgi:hypothetical protein